MLGVFVRNQTENLILSQEQHIIWNCLKDAFYVMHAFYKAHFNYCLAIWIFHSRTLIRIHRRLSAILQTSN